ncbi:MAG TPA: RNA polymerase sigma factor [Candidatus Udaeobacter sp.]|nr:RNA polymerase sigma factor [Candidatus Udaeobacter sp.]
MVAGRGRDSAATRGSVIPPPTRDELERVRARAPEALAALFERYIGLVYGLAFRLMGERHLAEDVAQEVFLKVHRAAHRLDPDRDPAAWLTVITTNACRDVWRSGAYRMTRSSQPVEEDSEGAPALTLGTNDPEDHALASERERLVQDAIRRLPESLRVPVVLHDYQGLSHEEIAGMLGIQHAAARKRYSRALAVLGGLLKETLG